MPALQHQHQLPLKRNLLDSHFDVLFCLIIAAAALIYGLRNPQYKTGYMNDDAIYVMGARDLWNTARFPSLLVRPDYPLPGLPLLLAPMARVIAPHWIELEWLSVLTTVLSVFLLGVWTLKLLSRGEAIAVVALFGLNSRVAKYAGILMPASFYTTAVIAAFLLMSDLMERASWKKALLLGVILGWASLLRAEGVLLLLSVTGALAFTRRGRSALKVLPFPVLGWFLFAVFWWRIHPAPRTEYGSDVAALIAYWTQSFPAGLQFVVTLFQDFLISAFITLNAPATPLAFGLMSLAGALCVGLMSVGFRSLWQTLPVQRSVLIGGACFFGSYAVAHLFWHVSQGRYALPVLPLVLIALVHGVARLSRRLPHPRIWTGALLALLLVRSVYRNANGIYQTFWEPNPMYAPPCRSLAWLKAHTPPDARVVSDIASNIELYANRPALSAVLAVNPEMFLDRMLEKHLTYVVDRRINLLTPGIGATEDPNIPWERFRVWAAHDPARLRLVFTDAREQTKIYQIAPPAGFLEAYGVLRDATAQYSAGHLEEALSLVRRCLTLCPTLGSADNLLGVIALRQNEPVIAERALLKTLKYLPDSTHALLNLATLYHLEGRIERANDYVQRALSVADADGDADAVKQTILTLSARWAQHQALLFFDAP